MDNILLLIEIDGGEMPRWFCSIEDAKCYAQKFPSFIKTKIYKLTEIK